MADNGSLVAVPCGPSASIASIDHLLPSISRATIPLADRAPGFASLLKISGNAFILSMVETLAEGHVFAEKSGLGSENLHKFIDLMMPGPYVAYSKRMMEGDYMREEPLFSVDLARKDAGHAINLAAKVGVDMKIAKVVDEHLKAVKETRGPSGDLPG